jgi:hypothetical protein
MSISSPQGNPSDFSHSALRRLSRDQRDAFQAALDKLVSHHKRCAAAVAEEQKLSNDQVRRKMEKLRTNLNHVCKASGPESEFQRYFWGKYVGWKASDNDRKVIAGFPKMAELMRRIVDDSITSKSYKIRPLASELTLTIAMQAAQLLRQFEIDPKDTLTGAWLALTKYILYHGCGRDKQAGNIHNYLNIAKGYFNAKKGEEIT